VAAATVTVTGVKVTTFTVSFIAAVAIGVAAGSVLPGGWVPQPAREALSPGITPPAPPCVLLVHADPAVERAVGDALDELEGLTGLQWMWAAPDTANLTVVVDDTTDTSTWLAYAAPDVEDGVIVRATVVLGSQVLTWTSMRRILLHELGHAVGLGHSTDPTSLMAAIWTPTNVLRHADLDAFAAAGKRCHR
jgi:hypothetical protein